MFLKAFVVRSVPISSKNVFIKNNTKFSKEHLFHFLNRSGDTQVSILPVAMKRSFETGKSGSNGSNFRGFTALHSLQFNAEYCQWL